MELTCPLCDCKYKSRSKMSYHIDLKHPKLSYREKSLLMSEIRKNAGWPSAREWRGLLKRF